MTKPDKRTIATGVDRQLWAQWFKRCVTEYLGSSIPIEQRGSMTDRRHEVAHAYDAARAEFGLSKYGADSENVRSWENGSVPQGQHLEPFLRVFGLLDSSSSGGDARPGEAYLEFHHATGREYQERSHYLQKIRRTTIRSNVNHVVDLKRFDKIGIYRGHYQGHTLQSFYAGAISEAYKLSIQAISETGKEDPTPEAETQSLRSLFARGIDALLVSHWSSSQALPEDLQEQVQSVPVLLFDSKTTAFEIARPMTAEVDQNAVTRHLGTLVRDYIAERVNKSIPPTILILNDRRHFSPLENRAIFWDVQERSLAHLAHFVHADCEVSNPLDFENVNRKIIEEALRTHKPAVVVAMWYEFARVLFSLIEENSSLETPHVLSVDLTDHGFEQLKHNAALQAAVYFDAFDAGRDSICHLAARLRGTPLQRGAGFEVPVRVIRSKDVNRLGASSVIEYLGQVGRQP